ncbi:hypothetical protein H7I57_02740 [Mycobacterium pyrenivorans]|nr:hypothetical protein [Mycolicibacterium pyrenivorans]
MALAKLSAFLKPIIDSAYKRNRVFQRSKWSDGIVNIPLPAAATPAPAEVNPPASGLMSSATTTLAATSSAATSTTEYSGQHRLTENVVTKKVKDDEGPKPFKKWFKKKDAETTSDTKKNDDEPKQAETQDTEPSNTTSTTSNDTSTNGGDAGES